MWKHADIEDQDVNTQRNGDCRDCHGFALLAAIKHLKNKGNRLW